MEAVRPHRWTRQEVERMAGAGVFDPDARIELVNGEVVEMSPQGSLHFTTIRKVEEALRQAFGAGFDVRVQGPLNLSEVDQPEPDVAVVRGSLNDYAEAHPSEAVLVVEVADTSLDYDRLRKLPRYAYAGAQEYWIVNLQHACVEVYRNPDRSEEIYRSKNTCELDDHITPVARPETAIAVDGLLP